MSAHPAFHIVIPARYQSTRLPGKPLQELAGKTLIEWVYLQAQKCHAQSVVIATDDQRIHDVAAGFGAEVCMTDSAHETGTDRIAEVAHRYQWDDDTIVVNLQGDEPLIPPDLLQQVALQLEEHPDASIATLGTPIQSAHDIVDPNVVKVVTNHQGGALYFSRAPIPWDRDQFMIDRLHHPHELDTRNAYVRHIGLYAYRVKFLKRFGTLEPCELERVEALEQLRALWHGYGIQVAVTEHPPGHGVDTPADRERVEKILAGMK